MDGVLFPVGPPRPAASQHGTPRVQVPVRNQVEFVASDLDSLIETDHTVRLVDEFAAKVDLTRLHGAIRAFENGPGRTPIDPRLLLSLWLYAALNGVGSARELERLCSDHIAYRWLCGGVSVNYHTLASFRSQSGEVFDAILTDSLAVLLKEKLVTLDRVAHDGMRTRAHASSGSFRGKESLEKFHAQAQAHVQALRKELSDNPAAGSKRQNAARLRAARERSERIAEALRQMPDVEAKKKDKTKKARVSMTDPDARVMKMPNGGYNPAYNVQFSADVNSQIIVGVGVTNCGSDHALLPQAVEEIEARCGAAPREMLVDGGFNKAEGIEAVADRTTVYAPPTELKDKNGDVLKPKKPATPAVQEWQERMKTAQAQEIYKDRAATIECVNAQMRNRNLRQFNVRGLKRVRAVVLLFVIAHNVVHAARLRKADSG